jgi:hypothetical protein
METAEKLGSKTQSLLPQQLRKWLVASLAKPAA